VLELTYMYSMRGYPVRALAILLISPEEQISKIRIRLSSWHLGREEEPLILAIPTG
jgi:hypothetical protein